MSADTSPAAMPGEIERLEDELALLEAAAPLSARETAHYLDVERRLILLQAAAIRVQGE